MNRKPSIDVIRQLRNEVGFGCPIDGCGCPYLEWHHFDPPWHIENHHNPEGMIALCTSHHKKADGGAYTIDQLRAFKNNRAQAHEIKGRFDWLRNDLLVIAGTNCYYDQLSVLKINDKNVIWFTRDDEGYLRLNVRMLSILPKERAIISDNMWLNIGDPIDLVSPPQGKELSIKYSNGDSLLIKYRIIETREQAYERYKVPHLLDAENIKFPITAVEINYNIDGFPLEFSPTKTVTGVFNVTYSYFEKNHNSAHNVNSDYLFRENPSLLPYKPESRISTCSCGSGQKFKHCHGFNGVDATIKRSIGSLNASIFSLR